MGIKDFINEQNKKTYKIEFSTRNIAEIYKIMKEIKQKFKNIVNFEKISLHIEIEYNQ